MIFELDKYYKRVDGEIIHIVGKAENSTYGNCLVGERKNKLYFQPIFDINLEETAWTETSKEERDR